MNPFRHPRAWLAALAAGVLLAGTACDTDSAGDQPQHGGTLLVDVLALPNYLDPQLVQTVFEVNVSKLLTRTLTTFRSAPGAEGSELVPDLATDTGRPSQENTVWEFTLKDGVRWEDGEPVRCQDLKYGVERRFAPDQDRQTGAVYPLNYLRDNESGEPSGPNGTVYQGPWQGDNNGGAGLESVECVDDRVIRYHLDQSRSDFNYTLTMSAFGPVRPGADDNLEEYNREPLSTGPYLVETHEEGERLVLERNPHWNRSTDPNRGAYPDRFVFEALPDAAVVTNDLVHDEGADRNRIMLDMDVAPTFLQQVMTDPELAARVAADTRGSVRYLAVNTERIPDQRCRQALHYATNKRKVRSVFGGSLAGEIATSMIPPNLRAYREFDHYGSLTQPDGQPERALELMAAVETEGEACPDEVVLAYPELAELRRVAAMMVEGLQRAGIRVVPEPIPVQDYVPTVLSHRRGEFDLVWLVWQPDWPNGSSVIPPLFDGRNSTFNLSELDDERINGLVDAAYAEPDLEQQYPLWGSLDSELQELGVSIPLHYPDALRMHGSNVRGVFIHPAVGMPDLTAIGLADPGIPAEPGPTPEE